MSSSSPTSSIIPFAVSHSAKLSTAIIINPISGGASPRAARERAQLALAVVDQHGDHAEVLLTERVGHARELAKAAVRRGARLVLAWGGDGTINEVASALAFDGVPLGIVPAGSGNGLARELGVHARAERAIADALQAVARPMDLGEIDGHLFANVAGIGFDAHIASCFATATRRGFSGYAAITVKALRSYAAQQYRVTIGGVETTHRAILVTLANSAQFGNNARIAPGARVDDGELDLVVMEETSRVSTIVQLPRLFTGTVTRAPGCTLRRVREVTIESDVPMTYHVDGEPMRGGTTLRARIHPGALMIAVR